MVPAYALYCYADGPEKHIQLEDLLIQSNETSLYCKCMNYTARIFAR